MKFESSPACFAASRYRARPRRRQWPRAPISDDSQGKPLERILTPAERRRKLLDLGFEPPGKVMNYWRYYPVAEFDTTAIARALLTALRDGYGYGGAPDLMLHTDKGNDIKL